MHFYLQSLCDFNGLEFIQVKYFPSSPSAYYYNQIYTSIYIKMIKTTRALEINSNFLSKLLLYSFYSVSSSSSSSSLQSQCFFDSIKPLKLTTRASYAIRDRKCSIYKTAYCDENNKNSKLVSKNSYYFTSSSNPTQVPLLEEVEAKVLQVVKKWRPSLFIQLNQQQPLIKDEATTATQMRQTRFSKIDRNLQFEKMGFDSLDVTEMIVAMEQSFGIQLTDQQALKINSISNAIELFFTKMNASVMNKLVEQMNYNQGIIRKQM